MGFEQEMAETKTAVAQLASWCLTVALHQEFGIGASRLERLAKVLRRLQEENVAAVLSQGTKAAVRQREGWIHGKVEMDFSVPLLRAPRTRREKQLRMAGDEAATAAWQIYAAGAIQELRFGPERLERLRQAGRDNYRQFNQWASEDGLEVAMERLRRCVHAALQEEVRIVDERSSHYREDAAAMEQDLWATKAVADRIQASRVLAVPGISHTDAEKGEKPQNASVPFKRFIEAVNVLPDGEPVTITDDGGYMRLDAGKIHTRIRIGGIHTRVEVRSMDIDFIFPLNTADVEKLFSASMNVTDMITIACGPEGLSLSVSDDALAGMKYTDPEITSERSMRSNFQLDYVVSALKGIKGNVLISLDNDYPLKIASNEPFTTVYYLAPRLIEGEAEE